MVSSIQNHLQKVTDMNKEEYDVGEQFVTGEMLTISNIYIDIEFVQFVNLGRMLAEDIPAYTYTQMREIIMGDEFKHRCTNDVKHLFRNLSDLADYDYDHHSATDDRTLIMSPSFGENIAFIQQCVVRSEQAKRMINNKNGIRITLDLSRLPNISLAVKSRLIVEYRMLFDTEHVFIMTGGLKGSENPLQFDTYFIGDLVRFNDAMLDELNTEKMTDKVIFCTKVLPLSEMNVHDESQLQVSFGSIDLVMNAATRFNFVDPSPCLT